MIVTMGCENKIFSCLIDRYKTLKLIGKQNNDKTQLLLKILSIGIFDVVRYYPSKVFSKNLDLKCTIAVLKFYSVACFALALILAPLCFLFI